VPARFSRGQHTAARSSRCRSAGLERLLVVLIPAGLVVVDDSQNLDVAKGGPRPPQGNVLVGVDLSHGPRPALPLRWLVAAGAQVQVDPAALERELVDLALAVVLAAGLERQDLQDARPALELGQQVSTVMHRSYVKRRASSGASTVWMVAGWLVPVERLCLEAVVQAHR
jgi:hypothetical protein